MQPTIQVPAPPPFKRKMVSVGVTGTNGKTTTTAWVAQALAASQRPVARSTTVGLYLDDRDLELPKSYDGFIAAMQSAYDAGGCFAAVELTSEALMRGFAKAWPPEIGVFTNLTHDHLDAHGSPEHYLASKAQLFMVLPRGGTAVLNGCDKSSPLIAGVVPSGVRILTFGVASRGEEAMPIDVQATDVAVNWHGTSINIDTSSVIARGPSRIHVPAIGEIYAENALAAYVAAIAAGVPTFAAAGALGAATPPPGRFEVIHESPYVVVDFAHTPDALERTLSTARQLCKGTLVVVFGAGGNRDVNKRQPMGRAASICDRVIITSDNPRDEDPATIAAAIRAGVDPARDITIELERGKAIQLAIESLAPNDVLVIAGRGHETKQTVGDRVFDLSDREVALEALRS